jgi:hypothetical protein
MRALVAAALLALGVTAHAEVPERRPPKPPPPPPPCVKGKNVGPCVQQIDIGPMTLGGKNRNASLLYFLERANEELERSFLEKRSFLPHLIRSVDEEKL